ncbi:alkaline-phosphatase-like protein [Apodospora peruviana]|uniref:GPI ethanolamine phosphate transferase 2 n=1 Tax=Apodospora peruviana TaxID=516989 RepID=A0AAE0HUY5_9PEZI|nr:alkaline-phosphatase-like protein [Apodospora peruviana]
MKTPRRRDATISSTLLLIAANVLIPIAILIFATGFFPYKPLLPGLAEYGTPLAGYGDPPKAPFDRLVFMVIDALRSDFVYTANSGFGYTQSLIRNGAAIPFTAHATSPTVTMPRLKAITTGSIPSFLDVVLNLDEGDESSSLASQDTWLAQMKAKGNGKLIMYGDDTWLKLFPGTFDRADGTTSFFVSDFTQVDDNVTRHIADELKNDDWNTMVLHYLGLDHIGHKGGPRSPHMIPKQREMDTIIEQIYTAIESEPHLGSTLFVVCGDHGMNDAGNHGASSAGETSPALVFMSPKLQTLWRSIPPAPLPEDESFQFYDRVEQSDLAPTLAALLGFPVPKNNLGALIPEFLPFWASKNDQAQLLLRNVHQILDIITAAFGSQILDASNLTPDRCAHPKTDYQGLASEWQDISSSSANGDEVDSEWIARTTKWLRKAQSLMSGMASNYDVSRLFLGQAIAIMSVILAISAAYTSLHSSASSSLPFAGMALAYGIMMFASSYVEEEQHFWYWATTAWLAFLSFKSFDSKTSISSSLSTVTTLTAVRVIRGWNQTGQKFAGSSDIVKRFIYPHPSLLWLLVGATYLWIHRELIYSVRGALPTPLSYAVVSGLVLAALTFKVAFTNEDAPELVTGFAARILEVDLARGASLVTRARTVFWGLAIAAFGAVIYFSFYLSRRTASGTITITTLQNIYTLLAITQSRTTNIPLFLLYNIVYRFLHSRAKTGRLSLIELSTSSLLLQFTAFFAAGGSNAISSVDLSNAYNGIADYHVLAVGVLTFVSNWAGAVYWTFASVSLLLVLLRNQKQTKGEGGGGLLRGHIALLTVFTACSVAAVMAACTVLRTHLFIWTVFSPKYLYCVAWSLGQHLLVNLGVGGLLFWLGL